MKNNKKLVMGLLALSVCTLIGNTNIAFANEVPTVKGSIQLVARQHWMLGFVTADELNVRSGPGTGYVAIDSMSRGQEISTTGVDQNGFFHIRYVEDGQTKYGWVSSQYIHIAD